LYYGTDGEISTAEREEEDRGIMRMIRGVSLVVHLPADWTGIQ